MKVAVLFSGDASSVYCSHLLREAGLEIEYLVAARGSRIVGIHDPGLTRTSARSLGVPLMELCAEGDDEISPLVEALADLEVDGLSAGAAASNHRRNRLVKICEKLDLQLLLPLWHRDPAEILAKMIEEGFEVLIGRLKTGRLGEDWLGGVLDRSNLDDFLRDCFRGRISPLDESGELETFVLAGPDMRGRIELDFEKRWSGNRGSLEIAGSRLVRPPAGRNGSSEEKTATWP